VTLLEGGTRWCTPRGFRKKTGCTVHEVEGLNPTVPSRPRHDDWPSPRRRARTEGRAVRLHRQHLGFGGRLRSGAGITCAVPLTIPLHPSPVVS